MTQSITLAELAQHIGAELGDASFAKHRISQIASLTTATSDTVSFFTNTAYRTQLAETQAGAIILAQKHADLCSTATLIMDNPYLGYARAASYLNPSPAPKAIVHPTAWVSPSAQVDDSVSIGAHVSIEADTIIGAGCRIGAGCVIGEGVVMGEACELVANVTLCHHVTLGDRVRIHPATVIGADGFGLANDKGVWIKIPQIGGVRIGDDVEIGANTTIDRGALEDTIIEKGVKLDNQIQIAHNVHIGAHTAIAGCVGIAGSTHIGQHCMIAGGVGIVGHIEIADKVHVTGGSTVLQSIKQSGVYSSGTPLEPNHQWHKNYHRFKKLDEINRRLKKLEQLTHTNPK